MVHSVSNSPDSSLFLVEMLASFGEENATYPTVDVGEIGGQVEAATVTPISKTEGR